MPSSVNQFTMRVLQGNGASETVVLNPKATFNGTELLTAKVFRGDNQNAILTLTPKWSLNQIQGYYNSVDVFITSVQTLNLLPGSYSILVSLADNSMSLADGLLVVYAAPGGVNGAFQRCLVSPSTAQMFLPDVTQQQMDALAFTLVGATYAIEQVCGQPLAMDSYDHIVRPIGGTFKFRLRSKPVAEMIRVAADVGPGLTITNNSTGLSNATVQTVLLQPGRLMDIGSLVFATTVAGETTSYTLTMSDYPTFGDLASRINTLGHGWVAQVLAPFSGLPTRDAFGSPETRSALNQVVWVHTHYMAIGQYWVDTDRGVLEINEPIPGGYLIPNYKVERTDSRYWGARVTYRAGYATSAGDIALGYRPVPENLQIACVATALSMIEGVPQSGPVNQQSIAGRQYSLKKSFSLIPDSVRPLLAGYQNITF